MNNDTKAATAPAERTMYKAVCADCGKACEVPFEASEARPAFCNDCFAKRKAARAAERKQAPKQPQQQRREHNPLAASAVGMGEIKRQLDVLNSKIERLIQMQTPATKVAAPEPTDESKPAAKKTAKKTAAKKTTKKK